MANYIKSITHNNVKYQIKDAEAVTMTMLEAIYPVGSIYLTINSTCPLASLFGKWVLVASGNALWTGDGSNGGVYKSAGLPNIRGSFHGSNQSKNAATGAFYVIDRQTKVSNSGENDNQYGFDASYYNSIYGNSSTVQPPAYVVNVFRRVDDNYTGAVNCVLGNTEILLADNTTKLAEEVQVGDILMTYNEDTQTFEPNAVLEVFTNNKGDVIKVEFEDNSFIELTSGHPFYTTKGWASYDNARTRKENLYNGADLYQLEVGDMALSASGEYIKITNIEYENIGEFKVYDYTIDNAHTFIGNGKVLHNAVTSAA